MSNPYVELRNRKPCVNCGNVTDLQFTRINHRVDHKVYFCLWCGVCEYSTDRYVVSFDQAAKEWDALWETKA